MTRVRRSCPVPDRPERLFSEVDRPAAPRRPQACRKDTKLREDRAECATTNSRKYWDGLVSCYARSIFPGTHLILDDRISRG
jgi:hypothetical protein